MEDDTQFYFESEQLALKNNKDYHNLFKHIAILQAQKTQAIRDIDTLKLIESKILKNPDIYLRKLQNGEDIGVPRDQIIPEMPTINWAKYEKHLPNDFPLVINQSPKIETQEVVNDVQEESNNSSTSNGRWHSHNRLWTTEEQKRLEELLVKYPPEPIEMKRFAKIAKALGNRTTKQVCSRVQKYFIKLRKAGLPIPGRIPKTIDRRGGHRHQKYNKFLYRPSTFFPENEVPVHMSEFDDDVPGPGYSYNSATTTKDEIMDKSLSHGYKIAKKIELNRKIKSDKELGDSYCIHPDCKCIDCEEPIVGTRWHCNDCISEIDYCVRCLEKQIKLDNQHVFTHNIIPIRYSDEQHATMGRFVKREPRQHENISSEIKIEPDTIYDEDYFPESFGESSENQYYNYLDPNFLPE